MRLSQEYRKIIHQSMDLEEGGRLRAIGEKTAVSDSPVLVIGLGGSGTEALLGVKKEIYDWTVREKRADGIYEEKPRNIEYLAIDIDPVYMHRRYRGIGLNKDELQILTMPEEWYKEDPFHGPERRFGRMFLMQNIDQIISALETKISRMAVGIPSTVPLYVYIITGLCGCTGGGMFLDIPYLVRKIAEEKGRSIVQNIGLFFMPDVSIARPGIAGVEISHLCAKGFAALKELDYLMNIEQVGDTFEQAYGPYKVGLSAGGPPYEVCVLLSAKNKKGEYLAKGGENYELAVQSAAEMIFNFVVRDTRAGNKYDIDIYIDTAVQCLSIEGRGRSYKTMLGDHRRPVSYCYTTAGTALAKLPMDDVMCYLAYRMYKVVEKFWDQCPTEEDIDTVEKYFHLSKSEINAEARANLPFIPAGQVDARTAINSFAKVIALYEEMLKQQKDKVIQNLQTMQDKLQEMVDDQNNIMNQYFKDPEMGPVFAQQCLCSLTGRSVIADLRQYKIDFSSKTPTAETINSYMQQVSVALEDLKSALFKGNKLPIFLDKLNQLYAAKLTVFVNDQLQTFCEIADAILTRKNDEIFEVASDLLLQVMPIFESYASIKLVAAGKAAEGTPFFWNIVDTPSFIRELEEWMTQSDSELNVNFPAVVQDFYQYLFANVGKWMDENQDALEDLNAFLCRQFSAVLAQNMDFFLEMIAESQGKTVSQFCDEILTELIKKAEVRYPIDSCYASGMIEQPGYSFICIPDNSPHLLTAARAVVSRRTLDGYDLPGIIKTSGIPNQIYMMRFLCATPLCLNAELKHYYKLYMLSRNSAKGLHLFTPSWERDSPSDIDWRDLPSPYPETEWVDFKDPLEHERNEHYREVLRKALAYGYVHMDDVERTMTLYCDSLIDLKAIAREYSIDLDSEEQIEIKAARNFISHVRCLLSLESISSDAPGRCVRCLQRINLPLDEEQKIKKSYAEMAFIQMYRPRQEIKRQVFNHEQALAAMEAVGKRVPDDNAIEHFVQCRIAGLVVRHPNETDTYAYFDRDGKAVELFILKRGQMTYAEYYLLDSFMKLPDQTKRVMVERAMEVIDSDVEGARERLLSYREMLNGKIDILNFDHGEIENGNEILDVYRGLLRFSAEYLYVLEPLDPDDFNADGFNF
ncbi:MAG: tubulin-like doman-containing protein [Lachnospiraceae bacterium]|nr:tubulin-like doman-containing protein [Lachnospiraceae bacterium]